MNVPGVLIAAAFGAAFFAAEYVWYYQPDFINPDALISALSTEHMKARAAVRHALIDPGTATFGALRQSRPARRAMFAAASRQGTSPDSSSTPPSSTAWPSILPASMTTDA
ncbi:hypothetical protein [Bradyrhizobium yuanmingense]|uniref:hypothetical protein n=1 Tax=Bradyrhizobium yuanmingense TaxID=108015 RepID=UPI00288ACC8D|nr:hypothetical protein [Bradyrhizobium sp. CB1024]